MAGLSISPLPKSLFANRAFPPSPRSSSDQKADTLRFVHKHFDAGYIISNLELYNRKWFIVKSLPLDGGTSPRTSKSDTFNLFLDFERYGQSRAPKGMRLLHRIEEFNLALTLANRVTEEGATAGRARVLQYRCFDAPFIQPSKAI